MSNEESFKSKVFIAILTAILAFVGAAGGTIITAALQRLSWERDIVFQNQQNILSRRLELIEKTVRILNSYDMAKTFNKLIELDVETAKILAQQDPQDSEEISFSVDIERTLEIRTRLENLSTEYATVLSLNRIYFGSKTNEAIAALEKYDPEWWNASKEEKESLLSALNEEYNYAIKNFKEIP